MKIAYLASANIPSRMAHSVQIMKMCQAFAKNRHDVVLLVPQRPDSTNQDVFQFYGVKPIFRVQKVKGYLPFVGRRIIFPLWASQIARAWKADIVYSRSARICFFAAMFGLPVILELHHSLNEEPDEKWVFDLLIKNKNLKRIVSISKVLGNHLIKTYALNPSLICVASDGADLPEKVSDNLPLSNRLQVGYIGHLYPGKGMEVIAQLIPRCPSYDFHIVGGRDHEIQEWKDKLKEYSNVKFYGFLAHSQLEEYRQSFDVFLAPFQQKVMILGTMDVSQWMSPLKIFEYMASQKPMIASDLPVLREVLNESNSILVKSDDIDAWVEALRRLENRELRQQLAANAYKDLESKYTWDKRAEAVLK